MQHDLVLVGSFLHVEPFAAPSDTLAAVMFNKRYTGNAVLRGSVESFQASVENIALRHHAPWEWQCDENHLTFTHTSDDLLRVHCHTTMLP